MGVVYKALGDNEKSLDYYYKSIDIYPFYANTYLNISAIYIEEKKYEDSMEALIQGIINNPEAHDLYYNRAFCYAILGKKKEAIKDLRKAVVLLPSIIEYIKKDKDFETLLDELEFVELINKNIQLK